MHKRLTWIGTATLSLSLLLLPSLALAQDVPPTPSDGDEMDVEELDGEEGEFEADFEDEEGGTVEGFAHQTGMKLDLRFWSGFANTPEGSTRKDSFYLPMFGLTFTYSPETLENFGFMFTFLSGFGEGDMKEFTTGFVAIGEQETFRWDFEALIRYSLPQSNVYLMAGLRYINWEEDGDLAILVGNDPGRASSDVDANVFLVELGAGLTANITQDGIHRVFANMVFGLGHFGGDFDYDAVTAAGGVDLLENVRFDQDWDEFAFSFDANLGYQASLTEMIDLSVRYRVFMISADLTRGSDLDNVIMHGLELTLGFRF